MRIVHFEEAINNSVSNVLIPLCLASSIAVSCSKAMGLSDVSDAPPKNICTVENMHSSGSRPLARSTLKEGQEYG